MPDHDHPREEIHQVRGEAADEVAKREEFLRGKMAIRKLIAEEHADDGGDGKGVENP